MERLTTLWPCFVLDKVFTHDDDPGFDDRLFEQAAEDAARNRVPDVNDPRAVGGANYIGHMRHNFLIEPRTPEKKKLAQMVQTQIRKYLYAVYRIEHDATIYMLSDTFHQKRSTGENCGIPTHTHLKHDIVVNYYPRVVLDENRKRDGFHSGCLRFYDPSGYGKRLWGNKNPNHHIGSWYSVEPCKGMMVVFEGHIPHDSTYFDGEERMCIPILCRPHVENGYTYAPIEEI